MAVSAFAESPQHNPTWINYELHRKTIESARNEPPADDGRGLLQPRKVIQPKNNQSVQASSNDGISAKESKTFSGRYYSKEEVIELIKKSAQKYGLDEARVLRIAKCESGFRFNADNGNGYYGVYQYRLNVWNNVPEGKAGINRFDAPANIDAAHRHMSVHGFSAWQCK